MVSRKILPSSFAFFKRSALDESIDQNTQAVIYRIPEEGGVLRSIQNLFTLITPLSPPLMPFPSLN